MIDGDLTRSMVVEERTTTITMFELLAPFGFETTSANRRFVLIDRDLIAWRKIVGTNYVLYFRSRNCFGEASWTFASLRQFASLAHWRRTSQLRRVLGEQTWIAACTLTIKVWGMWIFRLAELLNHLHRQMSEPITVELELALSIRQVDVANVTN